MKKQLSDLQWAVMEVLWSREHPTAAQVQQRISYDKPLARTTVATVLKRLTEDAVVEVVDSGPPARYGAAITRRQARQTLLGEVMERAFHGDPSALVSQLLGDAGATDDEVQQVKQLLARHVKQQENNND